MRVNIIFSLCFTIISNCLASDINNSDNKIVKNDTSLTEALPKSHDSSSLEEEIIQKVLKSETFDPGEGLKLKQELVGGVKNKDLFDYNLAIIKLYNSIEYIFTRAEVEEALNKAISKVDMSLAKKDSKIALLYLIDFLFNLKPYTGYKIQDLMPYIKRAEKLWPWIGLEFELSKSDYSDRIYNLAASRKSLLAFYKRGKFNVKHLIELKNHPFGPSIANCFKRNIPGADITFLEIGVALNNSDCVSLAMAYYLTHKNAKSAFTLVMEVKSYDRCWHHLIKGILYANFPDYFNRTEHKADLIAKKHLIKAYAKSKGESERFIRAIIGNYKLQGRFLDTKDLTSKETYDFITNDPKINAGFIFINLNSEKFFQKVSSLYLSDYHSFRDKKMYYRGTNVQPYPAVGETPFSYVTPDVIIF